MSVQNTPKVAQVEYYHYLMQKHLQSVKPIQQMYTDSIQTQYYDQNDAINYNNFIHHETNHESMKNSHSPSASNIALRIQQNIKEYQQQIKKNRDVIHQMECQRKFFEKLSQKQKEKIDQTDLEHIRAQYENKIFIAKQQAAQYHETIASYHQEQEQLDKSFVQTYAKISANKDFLMNTLIQLQKENQTLALMLTDSSAQLKVMELQIQQNDKTIQEKQAMHRKYVQLQLQIDKFQKINKNSKK